MNKLKLIIIALLLWTLYYIIRNTPIKIIKYIIILTTITILLIYTIKKIKEKLY